MELRLKRGKNGEHRWFLVRMLPLLNEQETITGWVGTGTDIHEKKQLEEDLRQSKQELAATNEKLQASNEDLTQSNQQLAYINADMDNFIYTASHDLKAPINNIEGLMKALLRQLPQQSLDDPRVNRTISYIQEAVERFKRTIASLTEVVKLQKDNNQVVTQVDLRKLLEEVKLDLLPLITETSAHIVLDLDNCPSIEFAEKNLRSILYNLLSNAIKYRSGERPPLVQVSCQTNGTYKVLTVEDNGLGMDLTGEGKLFSMFTRLHSHVEGSGIGLYMVKKIVDNAGGKIEVESEVGTGSTFRVYFKQY
jgi:signal transduction histidine kinase